MKLSTKLFIGLLAVLLCIIGWQSALTTQIISDNEALESIIDLDQKYEAMMDMKSYESFPVTTFSHIVNEGSATITIYKAKQFGLFYSSYGEKNATIRIEKDTLFIIGTETRYGSSKPGFCIFMPDDPKQVILNFNGHKFLSMLGFNGKKTQVTYRNNLEAALQVDRRALSRHVGYLSLQTDMSTINVNQEGGRFELATHSNDPTKVLEDVCLNIFTSNGQFSFRGSKWDNKNLLKSLTATIQLNNSSFDFQANPETHLKRVKITGTLDENGDLNVINKYRQPNEGFVEEKCDTLILRLNSNSKERIDLQTVNLGCLFEDINCSENIKIERTVNNNLDR